MAQTSLHKSNTRDKIAASDPLSAYWSLSAAQALSALDGKQGGLSSGEARARLLRVGPNTLKSAPRLSAARLLIRQFANPLILILMFAAIVSAGVQEWTDAAIVLAILIGSGMLSFFQEYSASSALEKLRAQVQIKSTVLRDGQQVTLPSDLIVPGDIVFLSAGSLIPADGLVLESKDFFVVQSVLTGEPLPVERTPGLCAADASISERTNCVFMGTSARSGTARVLIMRTAAATVFGGIAGRLRLRSPETEFERGIRRYGLFLTEIMIALVLIIFAANVLLARPPIDSLLFAVALGVGLSPELLPAIISVTLASGARVMASRGVIVRRLSAIENLGSMNILCTDKTGTLTVGVMGLDGALGPNGDVSESVLRLAFLNASFQTGLANPLDDAIIAQCKGQSVDISGVEKIDEIPYDFIRKRLSVIVRDDHAKGGVLITKGAFENVLAICESIEEDGSVTTLDPNKRQRLQDRFAAWSAQGYRVLALATKQVGAQSQFTREDECALVFVGFLLFLDPLKEGIQETIAAFTARGVDLKIITGDNRLVAAHLAGALGLGSAHILTGRDLNLLTEEALARRALETTLFAEVDPNQKERIILSLKRLGNVVGYLGDGINDAPALHAADVGISVDQAVDVAKQAADFVLLKHDLAVLNEGIEQGRRTFANTLKYIRIGTSSNFGNMISMAIGSLFLPFLPLLAKQILLNNFLSDLPALNIASDKVDADMISTPHRWDLRLVLNSMLAFGPLSSAFDILTFCILIFVFHTRPELFRTAWFVESVFTQLTIVYVIRTNKSVLRSVPGLPLVISTLFVIAATFAIPFLPAAAYLGFAPLSWNILMVIVIVTAMYLVASEICKRRVFRSHQAVAGGGDVT